MTLNKIAYSATCGWTLTCCFCKSGTRSSI